MKPAGIFLFALLLIATTFAWAEGDWKVLTPASSPSARFGHSMTTLPDGRVILLGGENSVQDIYNDLYAYNNGEWNSITPSNSPPPARRRHCGWNSNGKVFIHGGLGKNQQYLGDLWNYDVATGQWQEISTPGTKPIARYAHTATVLPDGSVLLLGGRDSGGLSSNEAWKLNTDNTYTPLSPMPMRLSYHVAELVGEVVFVFGEPDTTFTYNIVTNKWTTLPVGPPLWGYATSAVGENEAGQKLIFVFGGIKKDEYESDIVYEYNTATNTLTQRRELMPFTHSSGASTTLKQQGRSAQLNVFFFGGKSKNQILGATFQFSTPKSPRPGDLNLDGAVNALDVALLAARLAADPSALPCGLDCADVNQDGRVDILDLMEIALAGGGM